MTSADISQAHCREHYSCPRWTGNLSWHIPGRTRSVLWGRYSKNVCDQACVIHLTNSTCWWSSGGSSFLSSSLKASRLTSSGQRSIAAMSFGKEFGLSSYQVCYGAASRVSFLSCLGTVSLYSLEVTGVSAVYSLSQASRTPTDIFATVAADWITSFIISTLATHLLSSGKRVSACSCRKALTQCI
jgi:hypothetical protein